MTVTTEAAAEGDTGRPPGLSIGSAARFAAPPIGLVVVFVIFFIATPNFLTVANLTDLLVSASILMVLAMGQQLVISVAGIDLSVGSNLPWAAATLGFAYTHGANLAVAMLLALVAGGVVGLLNGLLVAGSG